LERLSELDTNYKHNKHYCSYLYKLLYIYICLHIWHCQFIKFYSMINDPDNIYAFAVFAPENKMESSNICMSRDLREISEIAPLGILRGRH
jgi:hypothetical protein